VSATTGEGTDDLLEAISTHLPGRRVRITAHVPYERQDLVAQAHRQGEVHAEKHDEHGTVLDATVDEEVARQLRPWLQDDPFAVVPEPWER